MSEEPSATEPGDAARRLEERLRQSEERYRMLVRNVPLGVYRRTCGPAGKLEMVNPALARMFGYDSEEQLHRVPVAELYWDPAECEAFSQKIFQHGEVIREELKMRRRDGTPIWIMATTAMICDESGVAQYFDGIMEDITAVKEARREAEARQRQLLQADKMISLGVLVSGVAHEINNPNQFIVSHLEPLKRAWEDALPILDRYFEENGDFVLGGQRYSRRRDRTPEIFKNLEEGTQRIKRIVDELRDYAREPAADSRGSVSLNEVVRSALSLLNNLIKKSTTQFFVTYAKRLPPVLGDYQRLEQVVINLVQNACQALSGDDRRLSISTEYDPEPGTVVVQVDDTGCGIAPEQLERIFDPFFTTKRNAGGTGLGLAISHTIATKHSGRLVFESTLGSGTTARLILPVQAGRSSSSNASPSEGTNA